VSTRSRVAVDLLAGGAVVAGALAFPSHRVTPRTPFQTCLAAADTPGPSGFASEVCEPLAPGYRPSPWVRIAETCRTASEPAKCIQAEIDRENAR